MEGGPSLRNRFWAWWYSYCFVHNNHKKVSGMSMSMYCFKCDQDIRAIRSKTMRRRLGLKEIQ